MKMIVLFENLREVHLEKDVGMIPRLLNLNHGYIIDFISLNKNFDLKGFEKNINFKFFNKFKIKFINRLSSINYILVNIAHTDVLMTYHGDRYKYIFFYILKLINPKLKIYIKLDMGELTAKELIFKINTFGKFKKYIFIKLLKNIDVFTIETKSTYELIKNLDIYKNKIYYLPNGFLENKAYDFAVEKEKIIISVGRIGFPQKNNELLLEAISRMQNFNGYKFYFIGPVTDKFKIKVDNLISKRNDLSNIIILTGNINQKSELYNFYKKAQVLCVSSLYEGFSLVMIESMYFGSYLLSTDLEGTMELTDNGENGEIIFINKEIINDIFKEYMSQNTYKDIQRFIDYKFDDITTSKWFDNSVNILKDKLEKIISEENKEDMLKKQKYTAQNIFNNYNWNNIVKELNLILKRASK